MTLIAKCTCGWTSQCNYTGPDCPNKIKESVTSTNTVAVPLVKEEGEKKYADYKREDLLLEIETLNGIIELKEQERHQWSLMCITKQKRIEELEKELGK